MADAIRRLDQTDIDKINSPETLLQIKKLDGWNTIPSPFFDGGVQLEKHRKEGTDTRITIHYLDGRFIKLATNPTHNSTITKELDCWQKTLKVFGVNESVEIGQLEIPKPWNRNKFYKVNYLVMPNMGIPINYLDQIVPGIVDSQACLVFLEKLKELVRQERLYLQDLNPGNILGRVVDGKLDLYPIDYEAANRDVPDHQLQKKEEIMLSIARKTLMIKNA